MAYPQVKAPYGFRPINRLDGMPYAGATRMFKIASAYGTNLLYGDLVEIAADGTVSKFTGTDSGNPVGVFVGCEYLNPNMKIPLWSQWWPANTVDDNAMAYVVDDPNAVFKVAVTDAGGAMSSAKRNAIGSNMSIVQGAGNTDTGDSGISILGGSEATTATLPVRVVDVWPATAYPEQGEAVFPELVVKINTHQYTNPTGV